MVYPITCQVLLDSTFQTVPKHDSSDSSVRPSSRSPDMNDVRVLTFWLTIPAVVVQFVSAHAAAAPRQAILALRTLVVTVAVTHRAVSRRLSCTTACVAQEITFRFTHSHAQSFNTAVEGLVHSFVISAKKMRQKIFTTF